MKGNHIFKAFLMLNVICMSMSLSAQTYKTATGTVKDASGQGVIGAGVIVKGTQNGTITDTDGTFTLYNVAEGATLEISCIGYKTREVTASTRMNIVLEEGNESLDEVIFVAYGTTKKSSFTGSASVVKSDQIEKISGSGFAETLQGMSAGVQVVNNEGTPGSDSRIQIRGISSMSGKTTPLYIVDGMPYDGTLTSINPSDIESMTVLKDAAASSLYGSRAANGVIVITTKKGKTGKTTVHFRSAWGTSDLAVPYMTKANPYEQLTNNWRALYNDQVYLHGKSSQEAGDYASANAVTISVNPTVNSAGETVYVTPFKWPGSTSNYVLHDGKGNCWTNPDLEMIWDKSDWEWNDVIFSHKLRQDYGLDVSGSTPDGKTSYYASLGYLNDKGYANDDFYKRYSFRTNVETEINKWLSMGGSIAYSYARQNSRGYNRALGFHTSLTSPYLRNSDNTDWVYSAKTGDKMYDYATMNANYFGNCPIGKGSYWDNDNDESFSSNEYSTISVKYFANFKLPYDLNFRSSISLDNNIATNYGYDSAVHGEDQLAPYGITVRTTGGSASRTNNKVLSSTWNNILTWDKKFGEHHINLMAGHEYYDYSLNYDYAHGEGIMSIGQYELASTTTNWSADSNRTRYSLLSFFGKADYDFASKYYLSASIRRDGSSRFSEESRWGNFWSVGGSWRASSEEFLKDVRWLNMLVFRASYGTSGNDKLYSRSTSNGAAGSEIWYAYQEYYEPDNLYGSAGYKPSTLATPNLKWEKNHQFNVATDFSMLNYRLGGTIEYYSRGSKDLLYYLQLPPSAQVGSATGYNTNLGDIVNRGIEITINAIPIQNKYFTWNIDANFSTLHNEVTYLPGGAYTYSNRGISYRLEEGHSLYEFYNVKNAGVDPDTGLLRYYIRDGNGGWTTTTNYSDVSSEDYQWCGTAVPKAFGSITNSFKFKDFDFSFMWYGSFGSKIYNYMFVESGTLRTGVGLMQDVVAGKVWERPGDIKKYPRWSYEKAGDNRKGSDFFIFNNDFVRLRNVTLGYTIPRSILSKVNISNLHLYLSVDNALTFGKMASMHTDPETGILGNNYNGNTDTDNGNQSARRVYMGGIQITF